MSAYLEQIRPASFRGVRFQVDTHSEAGQVRGDVYELEATTKGKVLGLGARKHQIEGFLHGDDAIAQKKSLQGALEIGTGVLSHPLYGEKTVQIGAYGFSGDRVRLGRITVTFEAVEIDPTPYVPVVDEELGVSIAALAAKASLAADFLAAFDVLGDFVDGVLDAAEDAVGDALDTVGAALAVVADARAAVARIAEIKADLRTLLEAPQAFVDAILGLFADITDLFAAQATSNLPAQSLSDPAPDTDSDVQAEVNAVAIRQLFVGLSLVRAVELVPEWTFPSWDAALEAKYLLVTDIQAQEEVATPDVATSLADLRTSLEAVVESLAGELVPLRTIVLTEPESAINLAYRLYGDPDRADEIAERNDAADPGALLGALKVAVR